MYEEVKDDELEDIIEEDIEDESDEYDQDNKNNLGDTLNEDQMLTSTEEREERKAKREELKTLKTALHTIKEKLQMKTMRIEDIKETLKKS